MKNTPLRIGRTKVPFGQFYGGPEHHSLAGFASDKNQFTWVPVHAFLPPPRPPQQAGSVSPRPSRRRSSCQLKHRKPGLLPPHRLERDRFR
jgi:hypothetical protein